MITFKQIGYLGRLGNQMFQFASTLGIAKRSGFEAKFPLENCLFETSTGPIDLKTKRNTNVKCDLLDCFEISREYFIPISHIRTKKIYHELFFEYDSNTEKIEDFTELAGYFQSEKYFKDYKDLILSEFSFKKEFQEEANLELKKVREKFPSKKIVSLHVRRGDYVLYPEHHPPCSKIYFDEAIHKMKLELSSPVIFLVFSDDPEWCKTEFVGEDYEFCENGNPYLELCMMSKCDHHIIANSSFSWWGAWLNTKDEKVVVSPKRWFGRMLNKNTNDLYCPNWLKV